MLAGQVQEEAQAARRVENIRAEGVRMRRLVENMLFLARSDAVVRGTSSQKCDWSDAVESSVLTFEPLVFERGLQMESEIQDSCFVRSHPDELRRVSDILLDNAVKYALPGGCITVSMSVFLWINKVFRSPLRADFSSFFFGRTACPRPGAVQPRPSWQTNDECVASDSIPALFSWRTGAGHRIQ